MCELSLDCIQAHVTGEEEESRSLDGFYVRTLRASYCSILLDNVDLQYYVILRKLSHRSEGESILGHPATRS